MKISKKKHYEQPEQLDELFGRKKKAAPPPEKPGINPEWEPHYKTLEEIRQSGVSSWLAGLYFREGSNLPDELIQQIFYSWIENYEELARKYHWQVGE
jgi:hypothetical protein